MMRLFLRFSGDVARDDAVGHALGNGRLAHARLSDEHGVVLGPAGQHLQHAADLFVPANDGVELALAGQFVEVAAVTLQRLHLVFGILIGHAHAATQVLQDAEHDLLGGAVAAQRLARGRLGVSQGQEQVLHADELILQGLGFFQSRFQDGVELGDLRPLGPRRR